jgi:hypothetical protein
MISQPKVFADVIQRALAHAISQPVLVASGGKTA